MFLKEYWSRELYLGLKVTASFDRAAEPTGHLERSVYHFFVSAWMIPPVYHSLRRESIKNASSASAIGVQSVRPTWFEDLTAPKGPTPQTDQGSPNRYGLKLVIREEVLPMKDQQNSQH